jgi:hypothetical protein
MIKMSVRKKVKLYINKEKGAVLVWMAVGLLVSLGMASLVIDVGFIQRERARMQMACDASALAGGKELPNESAALLQARDFASKNGYTHGQDGVTVNARRNPDGNHAGWYQVIITKPINFFFAPIMGYTDGNLSMNGTASFVTPLPMYIAGSSGQYGTNGIQNLSCFGPYGQYTYGDCYSARWLDNGQPNPYYNNGGYDFYAEIKSDYFAKNGTNNVVFQIYDPDTWNIGNANDAGTGKIDEIRDAPGSPHPQPSTKYDTTRFELYAPDSTPNDYSDDVLIASKTYDPSSHVTDSLWVTPTGWALSLATYGYGKYRINVKTTNGSSENGFNLRAGSPAHCTNNPADWVANNGTEVTALGNLPINFNVSGTVNIDLGYIPAEAAGYDVYINKFDTDVGATSVTYSDDYGHSWPGHLSGNGTFKLDKITVPNGFAGGRLHARYTAGAQDTSSWQMYFDGQWTNGLSELKLVD